MRVEWPNCSRRRCLWQIEDLMCQHVLDFGLSCFPNWSITYVALHILPLYTYMQKCMHMYMQYNQCTFDRHIKLKSHTCKHDQRLFPPIVCRNELFERIPDNINFFRWVNKPTESHPFVLWFCCANVRWNPSGWQVMTFEDWFWRSLVTSPVIKCAEITLGCSAEYMRLLLMAPCSMTRKSRQVFFG